jgi:hypothetical protein
MRFLFRMLFDDKMYKFSLREIRRIRAEKRPQKNSEWIEIPETWIWEIENRRLFPIRRPRFVRTPRSSDAIRCEIFNRL